MTPGCAVLFLLYYIFLLISICLYVAINTLQLYLLLQVSQVYQTIEFNRLSVLVPFASSFHLERVIVSSAKHLDLQVSYHYSSVLGIVVGYIRVFFFFLLLLCSLQLQVLISVCYFPYFSNHFWLIIQSVHFDITVNKCINKTWVVI